MTKTTTATFPTAFINQDGDALSSEWLHGGVFCLEDVTGTEDTFDVSTTASFMAWAESPYAWM